jgi:hypothetical protein
MADFDINNAKVHNELNEDGKPNGNKYYELTEGTIYRGSDSEDTNLVNPDKPAFFGFTLAAVAPYGTYKHTYPVKEGLKLLAIMEMDTRSNFYKDAPKDIKTILETNFGYTTKDLRYSPDGYSDTSDKDVMEYLCENYKSYDGYAMNGLKKKAETKADKKGSGTFHAELAVCEQSLDKVVGNVVVNEVGSAVKVAGVSTGYAPRGHVKSRHGNTGESESNSDSHEEGNREGDNVSKTLLFGGNSRIRFKKRGKQTKRKGKRTKKVVIKYKKTRAKRKRGGGKKKTVSFKSCKSDADCWLSEPECDTKNKICVRKKVFHK